MNGEKSEGEYQESTADPPAPEGETVGDLETRLRGFDLVTLKSAFMCAQLNETDEHRKRAYEACWMALASFVTKEVEEVDLLQKLLERRRVGREKAREAERLAAHWLYLGNRARERGDLALAERHYARSQKHHDAMNRHLGNGDGT